MQSNIYRSADEDAETSLPITGNKKKDDIINMTDEQMLQSQT